MTRAIILAAGQGTRLLPHTQDRPKGMVELLGKPLIHHQIDVLRAGGIEDIAVVSGYRADHFEHLDVMTFHNARFDETNMVASMYEAREWLEAGDDVILAYADIVYRPKVLKALLSSNEPLAIVVDSAWQKLWSLRQEDPLNDAETMKIEEDRIVELGKKPKSLEDIQGQYIGLFKLSGECARAFSQTYAKLDPAGPYDGKDRDNMYMTSYLQYFIDGGQSARAVMTDGGWLEVDTVSDLKLYHRLQKTGELETIWSPL